jgi:hypothetical protein
MNIVFSPDCKGQIVVSYCYRIFQIEMPPIINSMPSLEGCRAAGGRGAAGGATADYYARLTQGQEERENAEVRTFSQDNRQVANMKAAMASV